MKVKHWDDKADEPLTELAMRNKLESRGYPVHRYIYPPGTYFSDHTHSMDKIDGVLAGRFRMTMNGESVILEAGDCLFVPDGIVHSAEVVGGDSAVSLDAISK